MSAVMVGASIAGATIGGIAQNNAANTAADAQESAARDSNATQLHMYNQNREDQEPWRDAGVSALSQMQDPNLANTLQMDPGYQFRLAEGQKAIDAAAASRGMRNSGATMKVLTKYGQDYASSEFGNAYNRLSNLAGIGQTATNQTAQLGQNYANQVGANNAAMGNANAASAIASGNAISGVANAGVNAYTMSQLLKDKPNTTINMGTPTQLPATGGPMGYYANMMMG